MTTTAALDPRIGMLSSGRFYCFPNGYAAPEFEGTLQEVQEVLGVRPPAPAAPASLARASRVGTDSSAAPSGACRPRASDAPSGLRLFEVTVTPSIVAHAGAWAGHAYVVELSARSANEAIRLARAQRRENEGRFAPSAHYRARLAPR